MRRISCFLSFTVVATVVLILCSVDVNASELHDCSVKGDTICVKNCLAKGINVNTKDDRGITPLHYAAWHGRVPVVEILIQAGANVNVHDNLGTTPLHNAAWKGQNDVAKMLLAAKANVNAKTLEGATPLHSAAQRGYDTVARTLLGAEADINAKENTGKTPLIIAANFEQVSMVQVLLAAGADVNYKDDRGATALILAVVRGQAEIVQMLLKAEVNVNAKDNQGATPLELASEKGYDKITKLLLGAGADVNAKNPEGCTALHYAAAYGHPDVVTSLLKAGADVSVRDNKGKTPLDYATKNNHDAVMMILRPQDQDDLKNRSIQDVECKLESLCFSDVLPASSTPFSRVKIERLPSGLYSTDLDGAAYRASISFTTGQAEVLTSNSEQVLIGGPISIGENQIHSDPNFPALFKLIEGRGLLYLSGRATVTFKDGTTLRLGEKHTLKDFLRCIESRNELYREASAWALGWVPKTSEEHARSFPTLVKALSDPSFEVRLTAAESLGRIGDVSVLLALKQARRDEKDDWVREVIEESITNIEKQQH